VLTSVRRAWLRAEGRCSHRTRSWTATPFLVRRHRPRSRRGLRSGSCVFLPECPEAGRTPRTAPGRVWLAAQQDRSEGLSVCGTVLCDENHAPQPACTAWLIAVARLVRVPSRILLPVLPDRQQSGPWRDTHECRRNRRAVAPTIARGESATTVHSPRLPPDRGTRSFPRLHLSPCELRVCRRRPQCRTNCDGLTVFPPCQAARSWPDRPAFAAQGAGSVYTLWAPRTQRPRPGA